jgi:hypothetical protein
MSLMNSPEPAEEPNPFDGFSMAEVCGFVFHSEGEDGLRELLGMFGNDLTREFLDDTATELEGAGLSKPAAILTALAAEVPSELDRNPYDQDDRLNWQEWRRSWLRRAKMRVRGIEASLRAQNAKNPPQG